MRHITHNEVYQFVDRELSPEDRMWIEQHLDGCADCRQVVQTAEIHSCEAHAAVVGRPRAEDAGPCVPVEGIAAYLEEESSLEDRERIEQHLSRCPTCQERLRAESSPRESADQPDAPAAVVEGSAAVVKRELRRQRITRLLKGLEALVGAAPPHLKASLEAMGARMEARIREAFAELTPCFPPVFGRSGAKVVRSCGKVRLPIVFEWRPGAIGGDEPVCYEVSIEDIDWLRTTADTSVRLDEGEADLEEGREYMWRFRVLRGLEPEVETNGFFHLISAADRATLEEIEQRIPSELPEEERLILWGEVLEDMELYADAIQELQASYAIAPSAAIAYRIAHCYDKLGLEDLREEWNEEIGGERGLTRYGEIRS